MRAEATATSGSISQLKKSVAVAVTEAVAASCTGDITAVAQALAVAVANASATAWVSGSNHVRIVASTQVENCTPAVKTVALLASQHSCTLLRVW